MADTYTLNYSYIEETDNAYYSVVGCSGTLGNAEIPSTYNDGTHGELPVMRIGNNAFLYKSSLTGITIPESIISIGTDAFDYCNNLTDIYYSGTASQWASIDGLFALMGRTSASSTALRTLHIKGELVTTVDIENINEIKEYAFHYCLDITSIKIGDSVTSIGNSAFYGCNRATSLTIGKGITSIGTSAFTYCTSLNSITINAINPPTLGYSNVFENTNDCPIYVHRQSVNAYKTSWSEYANRIQEMPHKAVDFESLMTYDTNIKQYISEHGGGGAVDSVNGKTGVVVLSSQDVGALADSTKYGASIEFIMDSTTFILTARLKDQDGNVLGTQTVDLPLESVVVNGSYDSATKEVVLTLKSGSTIRFSVADLVSGLQSEITPQNKLSADYVNDASSTNKFVTSTEKTAIAEAIKYSYQSLTDAQIEQARKNIRAIGFITLSPSTTFQDFLLTYRNTAYYVLFDGAYVYYTVFVGHSDSGYYFEIESTSSKVRYVGAGVGNLTFAQAMSSTYRQDYALENELPKIYDYTNEV